MIGAFRGTFGDMLPMMQTMATRLPGMSLESVRASESRPCWRQASGSRIPTMAQLQQQAAPSAPTPTVAITVDIFLSAGPREGYDTDDYRSCNPDQYGNCSLWRVRVTLPSRTVKEVERVAPATTVGAGAYDVAHIQPSVSPDGSKLSFVSTVQDADNNALTSTLRTIDLDDGDASEVFSSTTPEPRPQFPAWYSDSKIVYHTTHDWEATITWGLVDFAFIKWIPIGRKGPAAGDDIGYSDANAHQSPTYRSDIPMGPRIVTFGGALNEFAGERIPRVTDLTGIAEEEVFELPGDWEEDPARRECHHPAWRPDGKKILCTRYQEPEEDASVDPVGDVRRLYEFGWSDDSTDDTPDSWRASRPLVEMLDRDDLATVPTNGGASALDEPVFPSGSDGTLPKCRHYIWKFAEWCADERYLVATLYCTDAATDRSVLNSRVVLIDLGSSSGTADAVADYFDLTTEIEKTEAAGIGTYNAVFSTCRDVTVRTAGFEAVDFGKLLGADP